MIRRSILGWAMLASACASAPAAPVSVAQIEAPPASPAEPAPAPAAEISALPEPAVTEPVAAEPAEVAPIEAIPAAPEATPAAPQMSARFGSFGAYLSDLRNASCPAGVRKTAPETIGIKFEPVPLQGLNPGRKTLGELTYVAGFHLTSGDKRFGGLSGLEVLDDGNLLAVSDQGDFVWVDLGKDGVTPAGARIAPLRDARGGVLRGKADGDAEGVAITDGMALVSFERNHRVLAYDLAACGAAARGAPIVFGGHGLRLPDAFAAEKLTVGSNQGPEALAVAPGWYLFTGIETKVGKASALSARPIEAPPRFNLRLGEGAPEIVGLDLAPAGKDGDDVRAFSLHRSTSPLATNVISVVETYFERYLDQANLPARILSEVDERSRYRFRAKSSRRLADMNLFVTLDNFEGIAAKELPDGRVRLFIISDDNFSASQRTLLMVFDVAKPG